MKTAKNEPQKVLKETLGARGLKFTRQRQSILDYLLKSAKHLTPEEIYRNLSKKDPSLGRATVFRTLRVLEDAGLADKILLADGRHAYEHKVARAHHDHMICVDCDEVIEFSSPTIERLQEEITKEFKFSPLWHRHEIFGKCSQCRK